MSSTRSIAFACALALACAAHTAAAAPSAYQLVDLGLEQLPFALNRHGVVVGLSLHWDRADVYEDGEWTILKDQGGGSVAEAVNRNEFIVGEDAFNAAVWHHGHRRILGELGGDAKALGISDENTIVGTYDPHGEFLCYAWKDGVITDFGTLGRGSCFARAIDPTGQYIVGMSGTDAGPHGFIHDAQGMHDLGVLAGVAVQDALAVNRHGHAAVMSGGAGYWNGQAVTRVPGVGSHAVPAGLNGRDEMVVVGDDGAGHRLFLFEGRTGIVTAIEPLVVNTDGWCFCTDPDFLAVDIADGGAIVGQAKYNGVGHGYMLVPVAP